MGNGDMGNGYVGKGDVGNGDMGNGEVGNGYVGNGHVDPNHRGISGIAVPRYRPTLYSRNMQTPCRKSVHCSKIISG